MILDSEHGQPEERKANHAESSLKASKRVAILQSCYIPWKGYFDLINMVDEFILYDDMQYTRRDWRNRNKIKTKDGLQWLTIPVEVTGKYHQAIKDTAIADDQWRKNHFLQLQNSYGKAAFFKSFADPLKELYLGTPARMLSEVNLRFLTVICQMLGIKTRISWSMDYQLVDGKTERLVDLCRKTGGTEYISGPAARDYIDPLLFEAAAVKLSYIDYSGYPVYEQFHPPFEHGVTVLDLLFHTGPEAHKYMKSF